MAVYSKVDVVGGWYKFVNFGAEPGVEPCALFGKTAAADQHRLTGRRALEDFQATTLNSIRRGITSTFVVRPAPIPSLLVSGGCHREILVFYCRTASASTALYTSRRMCCPTHCARYCDPCQPLLPALPRGATASRAVAPSTLSRSINSRWSLACLNSHGTWRLSAASSWQSFGTGDQRES